MRPSSAAMVRAMSGVSSSVQIRRTDRYSAASAFVRTAPARPYDPTPAASSVHRIERSRRAALPSTRQGSRRASRSEEHTSELQSLMRISYAVFCLKKKKQKEYKYKTKLRQNTL